MLPGLTRFTGSPQQPVVESGKRLHLQYDWTALLGEEVEVRLNDKIVRAGRVDGVTHDGRILWLEGRGAEQRRMFERCEGFTAWIDYKWDLTPNRPTRTA